LPKVPLGGVIVRGEHIPPMGIEQLRVILPQKDEPLHVALDIRQRQQMPGSLCSSGNVPNWPGTNILWLAVMSWLTSRSSSITGKS